MNERIRQLAEQVYGTQATEQEIKFALLIVGECIGILETEIELVKVNKSTACNDFDVRWHQGKIDHFTKLVKKSKERFEIKD
jgi:hypothetical protein